MSRYCRPMIVDNQSNGDTRIVCTCGLEKTLPMHQARRAYYQHQPDAEPIPLPHSHYAPKSTTAPPEPRELHEFMSDLLAEREARRQRDRRTFPDKRETQIDRCGSCGEWTWQGKCNIRNCHSNYIKEIAA